MTIVGRVMMRKLAAGLALGVGLSAAAVPAMAQDIEPPADVTPVVGMAFDADSGGLWLAGPDADSFVNTETGHEVSFSGNPESVQALAWSNDRLYIADIGDPDASREYVVVFRLGSVAEDHSTYNAFDFQYEDGPQDAKAMLISGRGRIYIVTSGADPGIYRAELEPSRETMNTLSRVMDAPEGVTDGVFLTDGGTMALRTATGIQYIDAYTWETVVTETLVGANDDESIAAGLTNDDIFVGGNPTIRQVSMPVSDVTTTVAPSPSPSPSASPSSSPAASPAPTEAEVVVEEDQDAGPGRTGTAIALMLAGFVAVGAAAATFFLKR